MIKALITLITTLDTVYQRPWHLIGAGPLGVTSEGRLRPPEGSCVSAGVEQVQNESTTEHRIRAAGEAAQRFRAHRGFFLQPDQQARALGDGLSAAYRAGNLRCGMVRNDVAQGMRSNVS